MRHGISGNKLSRNQSLRKATIRDIARAALLRQRITTTKAIAKEGRKMIEKLITMGKKGSLQEKRKAFSVLCDHQLVKELFDNIAPRFNGRQGGYTRIIRIQNRRGDNAEMVLLELTERVEKDLNKTAAEKAAKKSKVVDVEATATDSPVKKPESSKKPLPSHTTEKVKSKPKVGMIKKMFQRKVGGE